MNMIHHIRDGLMTLGRSEDLHLASAVEGIAGERSTKIFLIDPKTTFSRCGPAAVLGSMRGR